MVLVKRCFQFDLTLHCYIGRSIFSIDVSLSLTQSSSPTGVHASKGVRPRKQNYGPKVLGSKRKAEKAAIYKPVPIKKFKKDAAGGHRQFSR